MDIQSVSKENRECTVKLSADELSIICNSFYYAGEACGGGNLFHKLYSDMIAANNLCQYGHIDNFALSEIIKHRNETENKITGILSEDDKTVFEAYIEKNNMPIAFGNSDWCSVYSKIVGVTESDKIKDWIHRDEE